MEYYSAMKRNRTLSSAITWTALEGVAPGEVSQRQTPRDLGYAWNLKPKIRERTKQEQTHRNGIKTDGCRGRGVGGLSEHGEGLRKRIGSRAEGARARGAAGGALGNIGVTVRGVPRATDGGIASCVQSMSAHHAVRLTLRSHRTLKP